MVRNDVGAMANITVMFDPKKREIITKNFFDEEDGCAAGDNVPAHNFCCA